MGGDPALRSAIERSWWSPRLTPLAVALWPLSLVYRAAYVLRRWCYRIGLCRTRRAPVPLIVVGNLIVGGAGKTPSVIALVEALRRCGWTPGVISRGHGTPDSRTRPVQAGNTAGEVGDEPLLIHRRAHVPVWVGHDRVAAARALCAAHPEVDVLVADDGLQHLALARDAQLVVFDRRGCGNGLLLPAGPLREPAWRRLPPCTVVVYNGPTASTALPGAAAPPGLGPLIPLPQWWRGGACEPVPVERLRSERVRAAAGIGDPERFFAMLEHLGLHIERWPLPDHATLQPCPWPADGVTVVVTEKDAVKLSPDAPDASRILVATLDFALPEAVLDRLREWLPARSDTAPAAR